MLDETARREMLFVSAPHDEPSYLIGTGTFKLPPHSGRRSSCKYLCSLTASVYANMFRVFRARVLAIVNVTHFHSAAEFQLAEELRSAAAT